MDVSSTLRDEAEEMYECSCELSDQYSEWKTQIEKRFSGTIAINRHQKPTVNEFGFPKLCVCSYFISACFHILHRDPGSSMRSFKFIMIGQWNLTNIFPWWAYIAYSAEYTEYFAACPVYSSSSALSDPPDACLLSACLWPSHCRAQTNRLKLFHTWKRSLSILVSAYKIPKYWSRER